MLTTAHRRARDLRGERAAAIARLRVEPGTLGGWGRSPYAGSTSATSCARPMKSGSDSLGWSLPGLSGCSLTGQLLVDTGMEAHPAVDARYRPVPPPPGRRTRGGRCAHRGRAAGGQLPAALRPRRQQSRLPGRPILTQRVGLEAARRADYTLPELIEAPWLRYEPLDGEAETIPGVHVIPTPGHTAGHQSRVVRRDDGTVVVPGQSHDAYTADAPAWRARRGGHEASLPPTPAWIDRLQRFDPARVVFAHDHAVWEP